MWAKLNTHYKVEIVAFVIVFIFAGIGTLQGLLSFNHSADTVARTAVADQADGKMVDIDRVDENNDYFLTNGDKSWEVQLQKGANGWEAKNITQVNDEVGKAGN